MEKQNDRRFFAGGRAVLHSFLIWKEQPDRNLIISIINLCIQCSVKDPHGIHLFDVCQLSGSIHLDPAVGKCMQNSSYCTWHGILTLHRNAWYHNKTASLLSFSCVNIFRFCIILRHDPDIFYAGTLISDTLDDFMICANDHFCTFIATDVIAVCFLFYMWPS